MWYFYSRRSQKRFMRRRYTFESMRSHWHALQHAYIGPAVTTGSAAAFAAAHFKQAAWLGGYCSLCTLARHFQFNRYDYHLMTDQSSRYKILGGSDIENQRLPSGPSSSSSPLDSSKLGGGGTGKVAENIVEMKSLAATVRDGTTGRGQFKPGFRPTERYQKERRDAGQRRTTKRWR